MYSWLPLGPPVHALLACQVYGMLDSNLADAQKPQQMYVRISLIRHLVLARGAVPIEATQTSLQ